MALIVILLHRLDESGGGISAAPPYPPTNVHLRSARTFGANVALTWGWSAPLYFGGGGTSVSYESEVQETDANGAVIANWRSRAPHDSSDLDREIRVPPSTNRWQLRVRSVNNATPPERSAWALSPLVEAQPHSQNARFFGPTFAPAFE